MKAFKNTAKKITFISLMMITSANSYGGLVSFSYDAANDNSGLTSQFIDPIFGSYYSGSYFIETFDNTTGFPSFPGTTAYNDPGFDQECAFNSVNGGPQSTLVSPPSNNVGIRSGSIPNFVTSPLNNNTCFAYFTNNGSGTAVFHFDYSMLLADNEATALNYLGFYWGNGDGDSSFQFYSGGNLIANIEGQDLINTINPSRPELSNIYLNFDLNQFGGFDRFSISTTGQTEIDNLVVGIVDIPEPSPLALFGVGLLGLLRFRKQT